MNLTDAEIKKALECWIKNFDGKATDFLTLCNALDLINRLQAENERLEKHIQESIDFAKQTFANTEEKVDNILMAEYIDREKAFKLLTEQKIKETGAFSKGLNKGLNIARSIVHNKEVLPTADVAEVKHGKWQEERWCDNFQHTCSVCNSTVRVHPQSVAYRYCPYCGAKMDKRSDTE